MRDGYVVAEAATHDEARNLGGDAAKAHRYDRYDTVLPRDKILPPGNYVKQWSRHNLEPY
jgi:hypothetical protein